MATVVEFDIPNIHCKNCALKIQQSLERMLGVESVDCDVDNHNAKVIINPLKIDVKKIQTMLIALGFTALII
ncbi:MAG: heavy-metal-associated domain-containing protein [Candidatus Heimdallarchaeota archaeon]|nr:heavy-metal-associated domain-containing protein [Candidatus Heimdallarchaeota archaeon]MCK4955600.1 heavy-metal-associated domain-containing protein [Candidatus Heimdallarchaeota archaeon]